MLEKNWSLLQGVGPATVEKGRKTELRKFESLIPSGAFGGMGYRQLQSHNMFHTYNV